MQVVFLNANLCKIIEICSSANLRKTGANPHKKPQTSANSKNVPHDMHFMVGFHLRCKQIDLYSQCGPRMSAAKTGSCSTLVKGCAMTLPATSGGCDAETMSKIQDPHHQNCLAMNGLKQSLGNPSQLEESRAKIAAMQAKLAGLNGGRSSTLEVAGVLI